MRNCVRSLGSIGLLGLAAMSANAGPIPKSSASQNPAKMSAAKQRVHEENHSFVENAGQWNPLGSYMARSANLNIWVAKDGLVYDYFRSSRSLRKGQVVKMAFVGASPDAQVMGINQQRLKTAYMKSGNGRIEASSFAETLTKNVYPGVDLRTYMDGGKPRYDLIVAPGVDPAKIKLGFQGASSVNLAKGQIQVGTQIGNMMHGSLFAYQTVNGKRKQISANFVKTGKTNVAFHLGGYDASKPLIIDPVVYGSYYGGDDGMDQVRAIVSDADGGVYLTGSTQASQFPATFGPYSINLQGNQDAFVTKLQGDAYSHDYAVYLGGSMSEYGSFLQLDSQGNLWVAGRYESADFPGNTRPNVMFLSLQGGGLPTGGTFQLRYSGQLTTPLAFNASAATVQAALNALPAIGGTAVVTTSGGNLPTAEYRIALPITRPLAITVVNTRTTDAGGIEVNEGLPPLFVIRPDGLGAINPQNITRRGSIPTSGAIQLTFNLAGDFQTTTVLGAAGPTAATAAQTQAALIALSNIGTGNVTVTGGTLPATQTVTFQGTLTGAQERLIISNLNMAPNPVYGITKHTDVFLMQFKKSAFFPPLDPLPTQMFAFGGELDETIAGFSIVPSADSDPSNPIEFAFAGETADVIPGVPGAPSGPSSYIARVNYVGTTGTFTIENGGTKYITGGQGIQLTGVTVDGEGNAYVTGTIFFRGNADTTTSAAFTTTAGVFPGGRLLRNNDIFIRKYDLNGGLLYSCLVGGNSNDSAGGTDQDLDGSVYTSGNAIAVDSLGNAYITGISGSFNFPRTRGVYGEVFDNNANVIVTKINSDASEILFSTNLRTVGAANPSGIAVDQQGQVFVTGNIGQYPLTFPNPPGDPNEPASSNTNAKIQVTTDAVDPVWDTPEVPELPTTEGWLYVLNNTATTDIYSTYLGGFLDDKVYGPYVDRFGDVWVFGWTDSFRDYVRVSSTGTVTEYQTQGGLPGALITPLAFKSTGDAAGTTGLNVWYGNWQVPFPASPGVIGSSYNRDGFLVKLRIGLATVADVTMTPTTIPGGLGASSIGVVTLSDPAPAGGASVTVSISDIASASLDPGAPVDTIQVDIPEGSTTGTFTVYSNPVTVNTPVDVKAFYQGSFKIARLNIVPWLQQLTLTPTTVVGGNQSTGRIVLAAPAPSGGVDVDLITDTPTLVSFPNNTVNVPEGQTSVNFQIDTEGVIQTANPTVTASLLGVGKTQTLTITQASLSTVTFNPPTVAGGTLVDGTVTLNGKAGGTFTVNLTINAGTAGYVVSPTTLTFNEGDRSKTFTVQTAYEPVNTNRKITATRPAQNGFTAQSISGTLFINGINLTSVSVNPTTVVGGNPATGTVFIGGPAPAGGVVVSLSATSIPSSPTVVSVPASVVVPAGASSVTFPVTTFTTANDAAVTISATRGPITKTCSLTVKALTMTLTLVPTTVIGGVQNSTATVKLSANASTAITFVLSSSNTNAATVPGQNLVIPAGANSGSFTVTSKVVSADTTTVIKAQSGANSAQATLTVKAIGLKSLTVSPASSKGGSVPVRVTVTLDAAKPTQTVIPINFGANGSSIIAPGQPTSITIPANSASGFHDYITKKVSRVLSTQVSATLNGKTVSALLTVTP